MKTDNYFGQLFDILKEGSIVDITKKDIEFDSGILSIIDLIRTQSASGKKIIFIGNGGSSAIAGHGALDFWKNGGIKSISFNEAAIITCIGNDYGYSHVFEKPIEMFADEGDVLIAISSSGCSENILLGVEAAKNRNCKVITLSGFSNSNPLRKSGDYNIYIPSSSYGYVELAHQIIVHMILDIIMEMNKEEKHSK